MDEINQARNIENIIKKSKDINTKDLYVNLENLYKIIIERLRKALQYPWSSREFQNIDRKTLVNWIDDYYIRLDNTYMNLISETNNELERLEPLPHNPTFEEFSVPVSRTSNEQLRKMLKYYKDQQYERKREGELFRVKEDNRYLNYLMYNTKFWDDKIFIRDVILQNRNTFLKIKDIIPQSYFDKNNPDFIGKVIATDPTIFLVDDLRMFLFQIYKATIIEWFYNIAFSMLKEEDNHDGIKYLIKTAPNFIRNKSMFIKKYLN